MVARNSNAARVTRNSTQTPKARCPALMRRLDDMFTKASRASRSGKFNREECALLHAVMGATMRAYAGLAEPSANARR